jgi:hypothetical protein
MGSATTAAGDVTRAGVREVATALLPDLPAIGDGTAEHILSRMPVAFDGAEDLVLDSCRANSASLLDALIRGVPLDALAPSEEVRQSTRGFAQRGVTLASVMRGYRLGIAYWCERWARAVGEHGTRPDRAVAVASAGTAFLLGWLEQVIDRLADELQEEAERVAHDEALARADAVRHVLEAPRPDVAGASLRLGYDLAGRHLAVVLRQEGGGPAALEVAARELAAALTPARALVVRADVATTWCWIPVGDGPVEVPAPAGAVLAGHGRPGSGLDGFRRSHREALEAVRVALLAGRQPGTMSRYDHLEVASVCSRDPEWCRAFVAAQLGPLAAGDDATLRIRATLTAFFATGSSFRATAKRLGVHHNTVRYRLAQAERILGRPTGDQRLALEVALHLAAQLGPAVLED